MESGSMGVCVKDRLGPTIESATDKGKGNSNRLNGYVPRQPPVQIQTTYSMAPRDI